MGRVPIVVKRSYPRSLFILGAWLMSTITMLVLLSTIWLIAFTKCYGDAYCGINKSEDVFMSLTFVFFTLFIFLLWHSLSRCDTQRQEVARGVTTKYPSVEVQPQLGANKLTLPLTLRLALSWKIASFILGGVLGFFHLVGILVVISSPPLSPTDVVFLTIADIVLVTILFTVVATLRQKIEITNEALTIYEGGRAHRVKWEEARLFIIPRGQSQSSQTFELASPHGRVQWTFLPPQTFWRSDLPINDYNHAIDALNAYIVARTGLTLYDLRG
jgi:hypothetical protein